MYSKTVVSTVLLYTTTITITTIYYLPTYENIKSRSGACVHYTGAGAEVGGHLGIRSGKQEYILPPPRLYVDRAGGGTYRV
jgi:hypothetical protein